MAYSSEERELPARFEAALFKLGTAARSDGIGPFAAYFGGDGTPDSVTFYRSDGTRLVALIDGAWRPWEEAGA